MPPKTAPKIPDGMVNLMKDLARNVVKEQPENIYLFAAEYFENLIRERDGSLDKGYETFRQYEEDLKRRKHELAGFASLNSNAAAGPSASDATDMEVHGVAIKAKAREPKLGRLPMNRRKRLETGKSDSRDSATEEEATSTSSPRVAREIDNIVAEQKQQQQTSPAIVDDVAVVEHKPHTLSTKKSTHNLNAIEEETNAECETQNVAAAVIQGAVVVHKLATDELEQPDTPTNDTSLSDALTEPTVIELNPIDEVNDAPVGEMENEVVETHVAATSDDDDAVRNVIFNDEMVEAKDVTKLNAVPNTNRLHTPESDSGLSEKSFNLKVQENEENAVDEDNTIGDGESLNFSEIEINKEYPDHRDTPENDENKGGEEFKSSKITAPEPDANDEAADERSLDSIAITNISDEVGSNIIEESSQTNKTEKDITSDLTIPIDVVETVEETDEKSIEKSDEKGVTDAEVAVETKMSGNSIELGIGTSPESNDNENRNSADALPEDGSTEEDAGIEKTEKPNELAKDSIASNGESVVQADPPADAIGENTKEEAAEAINELSPEPWRSAMDKLSEKVEELDANQERIVGEIRREAETETNAIIHHDQVESHHTNDTQDGNIPEEKSEESVDSKSLDSTAEKTNGIFDAKGIEQVAVAGEAKEWEVKLKEDAKIDAKADAEQDSTIDLKEVSAANDTKTEAETKPDGDGSDQAVETETEATVDSLASIINHEATDNTEETQGMHDKQSDKNEIDNVTEVLDDGGDKNTSKVDDVTEVTNERVSIQDVPSKDSAPNEFQETLDESKETANSNELTSEKEPKDEVKSEPEANAIAIGATKVQLDSEDTYVHHETATETGESKPEHHLDLDVKSESLEAKDKMKILNETQDSSIGDGKTGKIESNSTDALVMDVRGKESKPAPDNEQKISEAEVEIKSVEENQNEDEEIIAEIGDASPKVNINESESAPIHADESYPSTQNDEEMSENRAQIEENSGNIESTTATQETPEEKVVSQNLSVDEDSVLPAENANDEGKFDSNESSPTDKTEVSGNIDETEESAKNNLKTPSGTEVENQIIESNVRDGVDDVVEADVEVNAEAVGANDRKFENPILAAMQKNEQLLNQMHSPRPSAPIDEETTNELETEKVNQIDAASEPPTDIESNTEFSNVKSTEAEADVPGVSGQDTIETENEIQPVKTGAAQMNNEEMENQAMSSAGDEQNAIVDEAQIFSKDIPDTAPIQEEFVNPIIAAMRHNEQFLNEMHSPRTESNAKELAESGAAVVVEHEQKTDTDLTPAGAKQSDIDGDQMGELSASNVDESFEHAETVILGDESVKDLDLLAHDESEDAAVDAQNAEEDAVKDQIEPDSLDVFADSLDASMEPDSLIDSKSVDSLEAKAATTIVVVGGDGAREDSTASMDDAIPPLNLSSIVSGIQPDEHSIDKNLLQVPTAPAIGLTIKQPLGDIVNDGNNYRNLNEQMKNQLAALDNVEQQSSIPMQIFNIEEVDSPLTPKPMEITFSLAQPTHKKFSFEENDEKPIEQLVKEAAAEWVPLKSAESVGIAGSSENLEDSVQEAGPDSKAPNAVMVKPSFSISHDVASSDFSDTDTDKEKEKKFSESGVDESSRDERDEVSEIENFDLSSCGEDSLEAMYYQIRKNEIMVDKGKQKPTDIGDDKIAFPGKATEDLEQAFREVSGKKSRELQSMESSTDEVIVHQISTDTDGHGMHLVSGGEIESETETSTCYRRTEIVAAESTDEEFANPIMAAMRRNEQLLNRMHSVAASYQDPDEPEIEQENDHFPSGYSIDVDDMNVGNIRRKMMASSMSEADSDYFEHAPSTAQIHRLTKDDFNISTAFEHMIRTDSTTDSESTIESAATKIQAGARGFLTRRRLRRSTSASAEKHSSIGNAAIDKSLDDLVENSAHDLIEHHSRQPESDETVDDGSVEDKMIIFGITDVKMEQKKPAGDAMAVTNIIITESHPVGDERQGNESDEIDSLTETTQRRRLMLQRGDAVQRYSTPEESSDNRTDVSTDQSTAAPEESSEPNEVDDEKTQRSLKTQPKNGMNSECSIHFLQYIQMQAQPFN